MKKSIISVLALIVLICVFVSCGTPQNVDDTGERVTGTYVWSLNIGISMESTWIFDEDSNTVTNRYYNGLDYVEEAYSYGIGIKDGIKVIKLKRVEGYSQLEYDFDYGRGYVMIAGELYETPAE